MKTAVKLAGVLSLLNGLWSLLQGDILDFVMFFTLGVGLLIDPKPGSGSSRLKWVLLLTSFVLALIRLASFGLG